MVRTIVACALLCAGLAHAQEGTPVPPKPPLKFELNGLNLGAGVTGFNSGLQVVHSLDESMPVVVTQIVIDAGWKRDPADAAGMSSLFERAWWASEVSPGVRVVDQLVNGLGCEVDSAVDHDLMRFQSVCPRETADWAMRVWSRLFTDPLAGVSDATLAAEAERMKTDRTARYKLSTVQTMWLAPELMGSLYPEGHPYHWRAPAGAQPLAKLAAWAKENVAVRKTTVGIFGGFSGDHPLHGPALVAANFAPHLIDPKLTADMISRWPYGDEEEPDPVDLSKSWGWPRSPSDPKQAMEQGKGRASLLRGTEMPVPPEPAPAVFTKVSGGVEDLTLVVGWSLPGGWRKGETSHGVLARVIAAQIAEHMDEPSMERLMGCFVVSGVDANTLACAAQLKPGQEAAGERVAGRIVDQISYITDIQNRPAIDAAASLGRLRVITDTVFELDEVQGVFGSRAFWISSGAQLMADVAFWSKRVGEVSGSTSQDIVDLAGKYIIRQRSRGVLFVPDAVGGTAPYVARVDVKDRDALAGRAPYWSLMATRNAPSPLPAARLDAARLKASMAQIKPDQVWTSTLANGLDVVIVPRDLSPVVDVRVVAGMGMVNDPTQHLDYSWARAFIVPQREKPDDFGGSWYAWRGETTHVLGLKAPGNTLEPALWMMRDGLSDITTTAKDKINWTSQWKKNLTAGFYDVHDHLERAMLGHLWGSGPMARRPSWDDFVLWESMSLDPMKEIGRTQWRPENLTLVISGAVEKDEAIALVEKYFGGWKTTPPASDAFKPLTFTEAPKPSAPSVQVFNEARGGLAEMFLSCRVAGGREAAATAAALMRQGLGPSFLSAETDLSIFAGGNNAFTVRARVKEAEVGAALKALIGRLGDVAAGKLNEDEVRHAVWRASMAEGSELTSDRRVVLHVTELLSEGRTVADEAAAAERFAKLDVAAVKAAFATCAAAPYVGLIGDGAKIDASLTAAGIQHSTVDWLAAGKAAHMKADPKGYEKSLKK